MRMSSALETTDHICRRYTLRDIQDWDEDALLESSFSTDNIMAILVRHRNPRESIRQILTRIATLRTDQREAALPKLTILAGLRKLEDSIRTELDDMPITADIMDHKIIGPAIREGLEKGRKEGLRLGMKKGLEQGLEKGVEQGLEEGKRKGMIDLKDVLG
jgi:predicted transposase YdaD